MLTFHQTYDQYCDAHCDPHCHRNRNCDIHQKPNFRLFSTKYAKSRCARHKCLDCQEVPAAGSITRARGKSKKVEFTGNRTTAGASSDTFRGMLPCDAVGEMLTGQAPSGANTLTYDDLGRESPVNEPFGQTLTYPYHSADMIPNNHQTYLARGMRPNSACVRAEFGRILLPKSCVHYGGAVIGVTVFAQRG